MRLRHLALPAAAGLSLLAIPFAPAAVAATAPECADSVCTVGFESTGAAETFVVPAGVTQLLVAASGGSGGASFEATPALKANATGGHTEAAGVRAAAARSQGGAGGFVVAQVPVTPGETLTIVSGGKGADASTTDAPALGGFGGGGNSPSIADGSDGAGGGGSFVFRGSTPLVVAGGGGGGGFVDGGTGGTGGSGAAGSAGGDAALGGGAGTTAGPGAAGGGTGGSAGTGPAAGPSTFGNGGSAAAGTDCSAAGGGGGYFGGGSGGCNRDATTGEFTDGGGGGGAGFLAPGVESLDTGTNDGAGFVAVGYTNAQTSTTLSSTAKQLAPGQEATLTAKVSGDDLTIGGGEADGGAAAAALVKAAKANGASVGGVQANAILPAGTTINPGTACQPGTCTVTFFVNGKALGDPIKVDPATGVATVVFTAGSEQGARSITARYDGNLYYLQSTSNAVTIDVSGLANTGVENVAPMLGSAAALLVVGAGLVAYGRRRPQLGSHRAA